MTMAAAAAWLGVGTPRGRPELRQRLGVAAGSGRATLPAMTSDLEMVGAGGRGGGGPN